VLEHRRRREYPGLGDTVLQEMKTKVMLLALLASAAAADDIQTSVSVRTNVANRVTTTEAFTRGGITNLIRDTTVKDGKMILRRQRVYHSCVLALEMVEMDNGLTWVAQTGLPFNVGTHFAPDGKLDNVNLMGPGVVTLDHFTVTNGLLHPISTADIKKANEIGQDMKTLLDPENVRRSTKEEFLGQTLELIEKHKKTDGAQNQPSEGAR
jgi:hypothetical protein